MAVVKINAIEVPEGAGPELEKRFAARRGLVESSPGFLEFQLLRPVAGESRYFVYTKWESEEAFQAWSAGSGRAAHAGSAPDAGAPAAGPAGSGGAADAGSAGGRARPVAGGASLLEFEVVQSAEPRG